MKQVLYALLILILTSCESKKSNEHYKKEIVPWGNNQIIEWDGNRMISIFYGDTLTSIGPLRYACFHYSAGDNFYEESVLPKENESYSDFLIRLKDAKTEHHQSCTECGDSNHWYGTEQNLEIITIHSLIKMEELDSALSYLADKSNKWRNSSNYADLYLAILMKKIDRSKIENSLLAIPNLSQQDSILIGPHWLLWQPIGEYNNKLYKDEINWKHYVSTTMDRIEEIGI